MCQGNFSNNLSLKYSGVNRIEKQNLAHVNKTWSGIHHQSTLKS